MYINILFTFKNIIYVNFLCRYPCKKIKHVVLTYLALTKSNCRPKSQYKIIRNLNGKKKCKIEKEALFVGSSTRIGRQN